MLQGTAKRWEQVAAYVRTRSQDEVIDMAKHGLRGGLGAPKVRFEHAHMEFSLNHAQMAPYKQGRL